MLSMVTTQQSPHTAIYHQVQRLLNRSSSLESLSVLETQTENLYTYNSSSYKVTCMKALPHFTQNLMMKQNFKGFKLLGTTEHKYPNF